MTDTLTHIGQIGLTLLGYLIIAWGAILLISLLAAIVFAIQEHRRRQRLDAFRQLHDDLSADRCARPTRSPGR